MVERYWGARGVYAADFRSFVHEREGGIRTDDLADALTKRGYRVRTVQGDPTAVFAALEGGVPPILLLDGGRSLHYVVLVSAGQRRVRLHDPRIGPDRPLSRSKLFERWSASGFWALLVGPPSRPSSAERAEGPSVSTSSPSPPSSALDSAMLRMRAEDYAGARAIANRVLHGEGPGRTLARRMSATARYLEGDELGALDDWNELSEPVIDLVEIRGAVLTGYDALATQLGLRPGRMLTPSDLVLARRRLAAVPALSDTRVTYRPLPSGRVEVRALVGERARWPGVLGTAVEAARSVVAHEARVETGPYLLAGDRWGAHFGWNPARRSAGASVSTALVPFSGVVAVGLDWSRERYVDAALPGSGSVVAEERLAGSLDFRRWVDPRTRLSVGVGLERWGRATRMAATRVQVARELVGDEAWLVGTAEGWLGSSREAGRLSLSARGRFPRGEHGAWIADVGATATSSSASRLLWPGAGVGEVRKPLLRAHPLVASGSIQGSAFGPRLLHATVERRVFWRLGPMRAGGSVFVDAARVAGRSDTSGSRAFVDSGIGAYAVAGTRELTLSLATGTSGWVLSARVSDVGLIG